MRITILIFSLLILGASTVSSQRIDFENDKGITQNLFIKLYGNIDYNQPIVPGTRQNGKLDVHRIVTLFGYQFSSSTQFVSELEIEHATEAFIEQAFVKHKIAPNHFVKAGLLLIPMGYINENHEATAFYSVERPLIDRDIVPSTWREIGAGLTGIFTGSSLRYKAFLVNGFRSYNNGEGTLQGSNGLRGGRQKGIKTTMSAPNVSAQLEYIGIPNHKIALSYYGGNTQSPLYNGLDRNDAPALALADSSVVNLQMVGLHSQSSMGKWTVNTQGILARLGNTQAYNAFVDTDLGSLLYGYYLEGAYEVFAQGDRNAVTLFARISQLDTHAMTDGDLVKRDDYAKTISTIGINYNPSKGVVFKMDGQRFDVRGSDSPTFQFNLSTGVWF